VLYLFLLFIVLPIVELWLLLAIGGAIGFWPTLGMTVFAAALGGFLAKREGKKVLAQWRQAMAEMRMPEDGLVSALLVLVGGVLLVSPGVISDFIGLLLLYPPSRRWVAQIVRARMAQKIENAARSGRLQVKFTTSSSFSGSPPGRAADDGGIDVIDTTGEAVESGMNDRPLDEGPARLLPKQGS
jgi:UPF0716 protein FxsA